MKNFNKIFKSNTLFLILIFSFTFSLIGCSNSENNKSTIDGYKDIQEALMNMESYTSNINVSYISNQGETNYSILQTVKKDGRYILETTSPEDLAGSFIIYDGNLIWQYNPHNQEKISVADKEKMERQQLSLFAFLENHLNSKDIAVETSTIDESIYTVLEAVIPSDNTYFSTEKLWLNNKTNMPEKLVIYDKEGGERVIVIFNDFKYNPQVEDNIFNIEAISKSE